MYDKITYNKCVKCICTKISLSTYYIEGICCDSIAVR